MGALHEAHLDCPRPCCRGEVLVVAEPLPEGGYGVDVWSVDGAAGDVCSEGCVFDDRELDLLGERMMGAVMHEGEAREG